MNTVFLVAVHICVYKLVHLQPHFDRTNTPWYLYKLDVHKVWNQGINGTGVKVAVVDDGILTSHPDIRPNYDSSLSYDYVDEDMVPDPARSGGWLQVNGEWWRSYAESHGTKCAGVISGSGAICNRGVAFNSKIGGIRLLSNSQISRQLRDKREGRAFYSSNRGTVDIYSNSWGIADTGILLDKPLRKATRALENGIQRGRNGKGHIYVWATGNGRSDDNCGGDGYVTSRYTIPISGVSHDGTVPLYREVCSAVMATTYSISRTDSRRLRTTSSTASCDNHFTGTSAASAIGSGILALVLQANSQLTWREIQHLIVKSADTKNLCADDWQKNGAGYLVSHSFGFGILNAANLVKNAKEWKNTGEQLPSERNCPIQSSYNNKNFGPHSEVSDTLRPNTLCRIGNIEHVQVTVNIDYNGPRGGVEVFLKSPSGTVSKLMTRRQYDSKKTGYRDWTFMTVLHWGESAHGRWTLTVANSFPRFHGALRDWKLTIWGTDGLPSKYSRQQQTSIAQCGIWDQWTAWSQCSVSRSSGACERKRTRGCSNPGSCDPRLATMIDKCLQCPQPTTRRISPIGTSGGIGNDRGTTVRRTGPNGRPVTTSGSIGNTRGMTTRRTRRCGGTLKYSSCLIPPWSSRCIKYEYCSTGGRAIAVACNEGLCR